MTARLVSGRMHPMFMFSILFGVCAAVLGLYFAVEFDLPSGPSVAATSGLFLLGVGAGTLVLQWMRAARALAILAAVAICLAPVLAA